MKGEENENQHVQNRLTVKAQRPVGFLVLCKEKKTCQNFNPEENDERYAAYSMEKPDKHVPSLFKDNNTGAFFCQEQSERQHSAQGGGKGRRAQGRGL